MKYPLIIAVGLILSGCGHEESKKAEIIHNVYALTPLTSGNVRERVFTGVVEDNGEISVGFKTAGELQRIYIREGQQVKVGDLLAQLDDADYKLGVEALQIQYDQVKDEVSRARRLFEKKSMSANEYEKATAGLRQLEIQLQINKNKLAYTRLYSPCAGIIKSVNYSAGEMVDAGTPVFTLLDIGEKCVVVDIPASVYTQRQEIRDVTCTLKHDDDKVCEMKVLSIVPKADSNQLYRMKLGFTGNERGLTSGMNVEVRICFEESEKGGVKIPHSALFRMDNNDYVWIINPDSIVSKCRVEVNPHYSGADVEVTSGLPNGTPVVRTGVRMLHEGEKVNIIGKPSATNEGGML